MAKQSKEFELRMQGMKYALKIAKEQGVEALEKECQMRGVYGVPIGLPKTALDQFTNNVKRNMVSTFDILVAITLHDEFGFGSERIKRFMKRFENKAECIMKDYCTWQDNIDILEDECNLKLKVWNNDKDVKIWQ